MFTASIIQFEPVLGEVDRNMKSVKALLEAARDADLVILPELAFTGYNFSGPDMAKELAEVPAESPIVRMMHDITSARKQFIVAGFNERSGDMLYNSSVLVGPEGLMGTYRKMHLFMNEKDIFQPGDGRLEVFDLGFCKIGMQICFDYLFPEPWRILAQKGAELIIHPSNLLTQNAHKSMPGISLMNKVFTLTANRTGTEGDLTFNGSSMIISPSGDVLSKASVEKTEILSLKIDPRQAHDKMITSMNHVFDDRRPEQYTGDNC